MPEIPEKIKRGLPKPLTSKRTNAIIHSANRSRKEELI
nr:MAG TPA: hypothetical protein [Caudoviricetes sp.]